MHRGTPASDSMKSIATTVSLMSILLSVHGMLTDSEVFFVVVAGVDLFSGVYGLGIIISLMILYGLYRKSPAIEYTGMLLATWFYTLLCLFLAVVTYLHSPIIVVCFGIATINAILAAYIKKGKINGEEDPGGGTETEDTLLTGIPSRDPIPRFD